MEIHELNTFTGSLGAGDFFVTDNGESTRKISAQGLFEGVNEDINELGNTLNGRIDNIIAGGDAPSEAEIIDARQGVDGTNYASLGAAIRGQVQKAESDINYNGILYNPKNNLIKDRFFNIDPFVISGTPGETIQADGCNIIHFINNGSASTIYLALTSDLSIGDDLYLQFMLKGVTENLAVNIYTIKDGTFTSIESVRTHTFWEKKSLHVTIAADAHELMIILGNIGEAYLTNIVASKTPIDYEYSVKTELEKIAPVVNKLNGDITIEEFGPDLKNIFSYKWQALSLTFAVGFIKTNGTYDSTSSCSYATIPVQAGERYKITSRHGSALRMYVLVDSDNNVVDYYPTETVTTVTDTKEVVMPVSGTLYVNTFSRSLTAVSKSIGLIVNSSGEGLAGKTWCAIGDSITEYSTGYHAIIAEETGAVVTNNGTSGMGYMKPINNQTFVNKASLGNVYDKVTVFGSVNDMQYVPDHLGTETDISTDTLGGCFNALIDNLYASGNYHIGIISPIPQGTTNGNPANSTGTFAQYIELLEKVCKRRGVPFLDLWRCSNMQPWDATFAAAYMQDNTHPNTNGHKIFAPRIKAFIQSL